MKARIINGIFWAILAVTLIVYVCIEWHKNGCDWDTLVVAIIFYTCMPAALWFTIDQTIKEWKN